MDKIVYREGCTYHDLEINGKISKDLSKDFKMELYLKIINKLCDDYDIDDLIMDLCYKYGKNKFCFHCIYGDNVYEYTLNIE